LLLSALCLLLFGSVWFG